jgi:hypothetical protein
LCEVFRAFAPANKKEKNSVTSDQKNSPETHIFLLKKFEVEQNKEIFTTDDCKFAREEKKIERRKLSVSVSVSLSKNSTSRISEDTTRKYTLRS